MNRLKSIPAWLGCILLTVTLVDYEQPAGRWAGTQEAQASVIDGGADDLPQTGSTSSANAFIQVDGGALQDRLRSAQAQGQRQRPETRYWIAYGFDVIPGVAVDIELVNTNGSTSSFTMMSGGFETNHLGLFSLYNPAGKVVDRVEIYNLARGRNYSGYPVYWLGDAATDQGVAYLVDLLKTHEQDQTGDRIIMALALHNDPAAGQQLRQIVQSGPSNDRRATAISWLGHRGEDRAFFARLIEDESEVGNIRKNAVSALARQGDEETLGQLQALYGKMRNRDIKKRIISAMSYDRFGDEVGAFFLQIAENPAEEEDVRKQAIGQLSQSGSTAYRLKLIDLYDKEADRDLKSRILSAMTQMDLPAARDKVMDIARHSSDTDQRKRAIRSLDHHDEDSVALMAALYDAEQSADVKFMILDILGASDSAEATTKLINISQTTTSEKIRKKATFWLGKSNDPKALRFFEEMFKK